MLLEPAALWTDIRAIEGDYAPDSPNKTRDLIQVILEFILYIMIIIYLTRASDEIAKYGSFSGYITDFWNLVDIMNVFSFICVVAIRVFWMINAAQIEYDTGTVGTEYDEESAEEFEDDKYVRIRKSVVYYR